MANTPTIQPGQAGYIAPGQPGYVNPSYINQPTDTLYKSDLVNRAKYVGLPSNSTEDQIATIEQNRHLSNRAIRVGLPIGSSEAQVVDLEKSQSITPYPFNPKNPNQNIGEPGRILSEIENRALAVGLDYNSAEGQILASEVANGIQNTPSFDYRRQNLGLASTVAESEVLLAEKERGINYANTADAANKKRAGK